MTLKPEQHRALLYLYRKGTNTSAATVREVVSATFRQLEEIVDALEYSPTRHRPNPESWCVHEIVDHLVESHRPAAAQLRRALAGKPAGEAIPPGLQSTNPFAQSWQDLLEELKSVHREFVAALTSGRELQTEVRIPVTMVVKAEENGAPITWSENLEWRAFAMAFRVHTLEHIQQIERTLTTTTSS